MAEIISWVCFDSRWWHRKISFHLSHFLQFLTTCHLLCTHGCQMLQEHCRHTSIYCFSLQAWSCWTRQIRQVFQTATVFPWHSAAWWRPHAPWTLWWWATKRMRVTSRSNTELEILDQGRQPTKKWMSLKLVSFITHIMIVVDAAKKIPHLSFQKQRFSSFMLFTSFLLFFLLVCNITFCSQERY